MERRGDKKSKKLFIHNCTQCLLRLQPNNNTNVSIENEAKAIEHLLSDDLLLAEEQACIEAKVWTALDSLPPKCREIFLMSKRDGMSYIEIATELQLSVKTVEAQITKAYKRLRKYAQRFYHFLLSFF